MKPRAFEYFRPRTQDEALELLERYAPEAKVLAGGQSLVPLMNFRLAQPRYLVDTNGITDLSYIREVDTGLAIGAMTRQAAIEDSPFVAARCPLLMEATRLIGHRTIRHLGTIGGALAHADPSAEYPAVLMALDGAVTVRGPRGERVIRAADFFISFCTTALASNELLTEVRLPSLSSGTGWAFTELSRRFGDYAIVGVAAVISVDRGGRCTDVRIALAGVAPTPIRCHDAEESLRGNVATEEVLKEVAAASAAAAAPERDVHASAAYRKAMAAVFVERALRTALRRARSTSDAG